jgi:hypothetical protein
MEGDKFLVHDNQAQDMNVITNENGGDMTSITGKILQSNLRQTVLS